jgi:hypothetical protein
MVRGRRLGPLGFWDDFKDEIESAHQSLVGGGGATYQLFAAGWFGFGHQSYSEEPTRLGSPSLHFGNPFGVPIHELQEALNGPFPHPVTFAAHRFLEEIIHRIKNATDWKTLNVIARPLIGQYSLHAGILYGIGESLVGDVAGLMGLAKLVALAGIYERIKQPAPMAFSDPMTLALTVAVNHIGWLNREAKAADEQLWNTLEELKEIARHPVKFIEIIGQNSWKGVVNDWNDLKYASVNPSVSHDFAAGRIIGRALYQIIMMILLVLSVAGVAVKLAARFPWLMRLARIISRGGKLEDLEDIRQGVRAMREADVAPKEPPAPEKPPQEKPPPKPPKKPSYLYGASDGGPGNWGPPTSPRSPLGQEYQRLVTGAPPNTEYKVPLSARKSGLVDFDGYDPERNTLLDAKDWTDWPPEEPEFLRDKALDQLKEQAQDQLAAARGTPIEWHVPTEAKASEIQQILDDGGYRAIKVVVTPKP